MDRAHGSSRWGGGISIRQDKIVRLWDVAAGTCLRSFEGHTDSVNSVCLSPDGHYALTGSKDGTIRLWDVESGRCLRTLTGHTEEIFAVGFSQDGRYALSNSLDNTFRLWELESGECLRTLQAAGMNIVYLSPGELELLLQSGQDTLQVWDSSPSACLRMFSMKTGELVAACYSEDARYTITWADQGYDFKLWDTHTGLCLRTFEGTASRNVQAVCMSRDGRTALSGAYASLKMWDLQPGYQCPAPFAVARIVTSEMGISVSDLLAEAHTARQRGELSTEVDILRRARSMPGYEHNPEVRDAWSRLYVRTRRTALRSGWLVRTFDSHTGFVNCVCLSADSRYAFSGSRDNTIKQWEVATGQCLRTFTGHKHNVTCVSLSADENHLLSGSEDSTLRLWEVATGKCLRTITGITGFVNSIALSADGRYALTGSGDGLYSSTGKLQLWELATGRCLRTFEGQTPWVNSLCLSGDERYALSGGKDGTPKLWKVSRGKGVKKYSGHSASVNAVCLSKDGRYLLSGSNDSSLKLWDLATMKCLRTFPGHIVDAACLSADDRYALTGGYDGTLKIWDLATGECLSTLVGHTHSVSAVSLSADGRYALSGSWDQTLKLWELDWELEAMEPADWDEGAQPLLENFLTLHTPYGNPLPRDRMPSAEEFNLAFTRAGQPTWQEQDFQQLLTRLGCAGYGWLRPEGVRRELDRMAGDHGAAAPPLKPATPAPVPPDLPAPGDKRTWLSRLLGKDKK